jgi:hypothetical protein
MTSLTLKEVSMSRYRSPLLALLVPLLVPVTASAQTLETETARFHPAHYFQIASGFEHQFSAEGRESAIPVAFEYALTNSWELLVEPVPYTAIRPKAGPRATGLGDLEVTLLHGLWTERSGRTAFAVAGEVKVATAESQLIGTDKTDYTGYLIGSRRFGALDLHANLGYTLRGKPVGVRAPNLVNFALGGTVPLGPAAVVYGEILGNAAAGSGPENAAIPEVAGNELSGTLGIGRQFGRNLFLSLSATYDNTHAVLLRPGFTLRVH